MSLAEMLKQACKATDCSLAELARRTGQTPQNLSMKCRRGTLGFKEFLEYMEMLNVRIDLDVVYPDGTGPEKPIQDRYTRQRIELTNEEIDLNKRKEQYQRELSRDIHSALKDMRDYVDGALMCVYEPAQLIERLSKARLAGEQLTEMFRRSLYQNQSEAQEPDEITDVECLKGKRVLVAEDNDMNMEVTKDLLTGNGLIVETAANGAQALKLLKESAAGYYDCILLDIVMPVMDGPETARQIRALPNRVRAGVPIIAMTASAYEEDRRKAIEAGMDAHLTKPININELLRTIAKLI